MKSLLGFLIGFISVFTLGICTAHSGQVVGIIKERVSGVKVALCLENSEQCNIEWIASENIYSHEGILNDRIDLVIEKVEPIQKYNSFGQLTPQYKKIKQYDWIDLSIKLVRK